MIFIGAYLELKEKPKAPERIFEGPFPEGILGFSVLRWWPNRPINRDRAGVDVAFEMEDACADSPGLVLQQIAEVHSYDITAVGEPEDVTDPAASFTLFCDWLKSEPTPLDEVS